MFRANNFDKLLDKATSNLRLDPDWPTILQICDLIRQNDCSPKYAVAGIKKKLYSPNPHQAMFALLTLESMVKNCGSGVHDEIASKSFCETLRDLVKTTQHDNLKSKIIELLQAWAFAFRNSPKYRAVQDIVNILKAEGFKFPVLKESDAMFSADTAPEWAEGDVCHRCRVVFSLIVRRHHCRACGQVFCQQCSSKTSTLPKFGIEKEVRVCDACYDKVSRPPASSTKIEVVDTSNDYGPNQPQKRTGKSAEELQEEEELQLALALSQSEAEQKEKERRNRSQIMPDTSALHPTISPSVSSVSASPEHSSTANAELSRYLDRSYWEQRANRDSVAAPTAPTPSSNATQDSVEPEYALPCKVLQEDDSEDKEIDEFVDTLKSQIEIFVNRMKSNSSRGRSIANDTSVQTLFMNLTTMHSRLLRYIQQLDDKRVYLESLQDKVTQVRDSRAALDTLRAEHAAQLAAAAEAAERQRQMQMAAKLQAMRKKKHEYLQYQRQLALQKVQEQEREMQMRQEQQKHQYMMTSSGGYYMPGVSMHQFQPGFPNQPMYGSSQYHPQMMPTTETMNLPGQPQVSQTIGGQMGTMSQSLPQMSNTYAMSTGMVPGQHGINQPNIRQTISQLPIQQQMMMQQMHMRMQNQPGVHQMMQHNLANGLTGQNIAQQNGQTNPQLPKNINQSNTMGPNIPQSVMNPGNPMAMQMQNIRMSMPPSSQQNQNPQYQGYNMNMMNQQNNPQSISQPNIQGQPMMHNMSMPNHIPQTSQSAPQSTQVTHTQGQMPQQLPQNLGQGQMPSHLPPQQGILRHPTTAPSNLPQNQQVPNQSMAQGQSHQGQIMTNHPMMPNNMPQPNTQMQGHPAQQVQQGQMPNMQSQSHIPNQIQQHMMPQVQPGQSQMQHQMSQGQSMPHIAQGQSLPQGQSVAQVSQAQQMSQGQPMPQQMNQGHTMPQQMNQGQSMPQQMNQGQQMTQGQPMPQGQPVHQPASQGQTNPAQQLPQGGSPQNSQVQLKMQQNFVNSSQQSNNQPPQKAENNNNTAELIRFD